MVSFQNRGNKRGVSINGKVITIDVDPIPWINQPVRIYANFTVPKGKLQLYTASEQREVQLCHVTCPQSRMQSNLTGSGVRNFPPTKDPSRTQAHED